ncbi:MAG: cytoskeleton protein RodZ [Rubrobacteraceae bacterium]|jgi:hypothetical protein|nr:cytoskeleton protein RodZ [Rubrobacteraceae bacterium]
MDLRRRSRRSRRRGRGVIFWILLLVVMLFLVAGFLLYWNQIKDLDTIVTTPGPTEVVQEEPTTVEETSSPLEGEPTIAEGTTGSPEEENGVRVVVSVVSAGGVGLSILEDGQLVYDQVASPGFFEEFQAEEAVTITAADGGAVQVGVGGENPEPLGASGEWTTRTFTAES